MFTGIVEEIGHIRSIQHSSQSVRLVIEAHKVLEQTRVGDSIAVNGICLTVTGMSTSWFSADVMPETLRRTSLSQLRSQSPVNLERALRLGDRLGGHLVSGHIDGTGTLTSKQRENNALLIRVAADSSILRYVISKGSITLDGVSLTVVAVDNTGFDVSLIPHTAGETILGQRQTGDLINLECDQIGKYVEKLLFLGNPAAGAQLVSPGQQARENPVTIDLAFLKEHGF